MSKPKMLGHFDPGPTFEAPTHTFMPLREPAHGRRYAIVTEEDAVLIAGELGELGVRAVVRGSRLCPHCGARVPEQASCIRCRRPLDTAA